jgi:hypothetical protein
MGNAASDKIVTGFATIFYQSVKDFSCVEIKIKPLLLFLTAVCNLHVYCTYAGKMVNFKYKYEFHILLCMCGRLRNKTYYCILQMYVYI